MAIEIANCRTLLGLTPSQGVLEKDFLPLFRSAPPPAKTRDEEIEKWDQMIAVGFSRFEYTQDPRIRGVDTAFQNLFRRDYGELETSEHDSRYPVAWFSSEERREREIEPDLKRLRYENRRYEITIRSFLEGSHPYVLPYLLRMASFEWHRFTKWVRKDLVTRKIPQTLIGSSANQAGCDAGDDVLEAWMCPKRYAYTTLYENMFAFSDDELRLLVSWTTKNLFTLHQMCALECGTSTYLDHLVQEFEDRYLRIQQRAMEALQNRNAMGLAASAIVVPDPAQAAKIGELVLKNAWIHGVQNIHNTAIWTLQEHGIDMIQKTLILGAVVVLSGGSSPVALFVRGLLSNAARAAIVGMSAQGARLAIGLVAPQSRFGVTGMQAVDESLTLGANVIPFLICPAITSVFPTLKGVAAAGADVSWALRGAVAESVGITPEKIMAFKIRMLVTKELLKDQLDFRRSATALGLGQKAITLSAIDQALHNRTDASSLTAANHLKELIVRHPRLDGSLSSDQYYARQVRAFRMAGVPTRDGIRATSASYPFNH